MGLVEVKESQGDQVFEEAIEPETPGIGVVSEGGNAVFFGNVNLDSRDEVDNFEEAVEASHDIQQNDDGSHEAKGDEEPSVAKSENGSSDHMNLGNTQSHDDAQETIKDRQDRDVHKILGTRDANDAKGGNDYV